jgi:hypothetical protein
VNLDITAPGSYRYDAKSVGQNGVDSQSAIPAGTFSIFFHRGMAYSIQLDSVALKTLDGLIDSQAVVKGEPDLGATSALTSNAVRYWRLRWGGDDQVLSPDIVNERLKVIDRAKLLKRASP